MKWDDRLAEALANLPPADTANYLRSAGWQHVGQFGPYGQMFRLELDRGSKEVVLPSRPDIGDFAERMAEVVATLAEHERRPVASIVQSLAMSSFDVIRVRSLDADQFGSIRFSEGVELHGEARGLVRAAALAAASETKKRAYRGRTPTSVTTYLDRVRLGQTENASFAINILSPHAFEDETQADFLREVPFGRRVTEVFASAMAGVAEGLEAAIIDQGDALARKQEVGVSAEFCSSLAKLADNDLGVEVRLAWSPSRPKDGRPPVLQLRRADAAWLRHAATHLKEAEPEVGIAIHGRIQQATDPEIGDGWFTIETQLPETNGLKKVRVQLPGERAAALDAMRDGRWVSVTGDLAREGGRLWLTQPRDFVVLRADDD